MQRTRWCVLVCLNLDLAPSRRPDLLFYSTSNAAKLRNIAHSPRVSFHLQSDPYGDNSLIVESTAGIDATLPSSDAHER